MNEMEPDSPMNVFPTNSRPYPEDMKDWIGGEAALGLQAEDHVRWREQTGANGTVITLLGLAFGGGFALGSVLCALWRRRS